MSQAHPRRVSRPLRVAGSADVPIDTLGGCWCSGWWGQRLLAADACDCVVIRVDSIDGELIVTQEIRRKSPEE
jgi:hypothetical protein